MRSTANTSSEWPKAFQDLGFDVLDVPLNFRALRATYPKLGHDGVSGLDFVRFMTQRWQPDIIITKGLNLVGSPNELRKLVGSECLVVGHSTDSHGHALAAEFDAVIAGCSSLTSKFASRGVRSTTIGNGIDTRFINRRLSLPRLRSRAVFVGALGNGYSLRRRIVTALWENNLLDVYSPDIDLFTQVSHSEPSNRGLLSAGVSGRKMMALLSRYPVVVHVPGDAYLNPSCSDALRIYEATAARACLATLCAADLHRQFSADSGHAEVACFSADNVAAVVANLLADPAEARRIAIRGFNRTVRSHTIPTKARKIVEFLHQSFGVNAVSG